MPAFMRLAAMMQQRPTGKELHVSRCSLGYPVVGRALGGAIGGCGGAVAICEVSEVFMMLAEVADAMAGSVSGCGQVVWLEEFLGEMWCGHLGAVSGVAFVIVAGKASPKGGASLRHVCARWSLLQTATTSMER